MQVDVKRHRENHPTIGGGTKWVVLCSANDWARLRNVPLPEPYLLGITAGLSLQQIRPWRLPGPRLAYHLVGWPMLAAGTYVILRSLRAADVVQLVHPDQLVSSGPYEVSRNPMYVGWGLLHLGVGAARGSGWVVTTFPAAAAWIHHEVLREERALDARFGDEFKRYRAVVPRYFAVRAAGRRWRGIA
jgi:protein-S-isoprenylcysteine O-methyltransferase Ste14